MRTRLATTLVALLVLVPLGCAKRQSPAPDKPAASANAQRYDLRGIVRSVDREKREITVDHEEIPGFMDAMTMPFAVRDDPQVFDIVHAGDRIEAKLVVDAGDYWLEQLLTRGFVPTLVGGAATPAATSVTPAPNRGVGVGDRVPDFTLTDQTGKAVRFSELRGEPVAVSFLYTRCPIATACPMTATRFAKLDAMLAGKGFGRLITISVDPEYDDPKVLSDFAKKLGADPRRWLFLTGDPKAVADVASSFGVMYYPDKGQIVHTQAVAIVDTDGKLATIYYGEKWEPEHLLRDLEKARKG